MGAVLPITPCHLNLAVLDCFLSQSHSIRILTGDMSDPKDPPLPAAQSPSCSSQPPVVVRSVWHDNLESEFELIRSVIDKYPIVSMDTEFPGIVVRSVAADSLSPHRDPNTHYLSLKHNVDLLNLIQIGLTFADDRGHLPDLGTENLFIWEFNFRDFDVNRDAHAPDSVELLRRQGIDFERNMKCGVDSVRFAELLISSGVVLNDSVSWVAFHSAYDFGYMVKCLTHKPLPENLADFLDVVRMFFGARIYDVKHLMRFSAYLYGGLDRVCKELHLERVIGKSHQAGSDSLLTLHAYQIIRARYFKDKDDDELVVYANVLYGLGLVA